MVLTISNLGIERLTKDKICWFWNYNSKDRTEKSNENAVARVWRLIWDLDVGKTLLSSLKFFGIFLRLLIIK